MRTRSRARIAALTAVGALALAGSAAAALQALPSDGSQVNDDPASSIDPHLDAGVSDVAGGTVVPGNLQVPWAAFEQRVAGAGQQVFVRAFKGGAWVTQGFPASLNIDPSKDAEEPSIDFAGAGRAVPWVGWYEPNDHLDGGGATNVFASRFAAAANLWLPSGQDRSAGFHVPSLNIHTDRDAENPAVVGGATVAGNDPVPWVAWQEVDGQDSTDQIFVSRAVKQAAGGTPCGGFAPGSGPNVNAFCWQQVGLGRLAPDGRSSATGDPTLSIDPTRSAVEPDDAFTGPGDTVPWVVWYEQGASGIGLRGTDQVFAAKAVADAAAPGGFHWVAVGRGTAGQSNVLDTSATHGFGACAASPDSEDACSLNSAPGASAEDPRVAAGSLVPGAPTVPWVVWSEDIGGGTHAIFVARLVGGDHFELFNSGQPVSNTVNDSTRPDIAFSGTTPYITWQERVGAQTRTFSGHFEGGASAPVFKLDTPGGIASSPAGSVADLRAPVSSTCTATPANADGAACQAAAAGTPFFLHADGPSGSQRLLAHAYAPGASVTGGASAVTASSADVAGSVEPGGGPVKVHFEFGPTSAYGSATVDQRLSPAVVATPVSAALAGLPAGTTIHYRLVASSDFGSVPGADATLTTAPAPAAPASPALPAVAQPSLPSIVSRPALRVLRAPVRVSLHRLGRGRLLSLRLSVSRPSVVTIDLRLGRKLVRHVVVRRGHAGAFTATVRLRGLHAGRYVLRIVARDAAGRTSAPAQRALRIVR